LLRSFDHRRKPSFRSAGVDPDLGPQAEWSGFNKLSGTYKPGQLDFVEVRVYMNVEVRVYIHVRV